MLSRINYCGNVFILLTLIYITRLVLSEIFEDNISEVDEWLEQNDLGEYKKLFKDLGEQNNEKNRRIFLILLRTVYIVGL